MDYEVKLISELPTSEVLEKYSKALAILDASFEANWEFRYFSFDAKWDLENRERMGSMRDGQGSHYFILFTGDNVIGKVFDIDDGIRLGNLKDIPRSLQNFVEEPAFAINERTYLFWYMGSENRWQTDSPNLSGYSFLAFLTDPSTYHRWAEEYYEREIPLDIIVDIYQDPFKNRDLLTHLTGEKYDEQVEDEISNILDITDG
jgi:hypothetical protein